MSKAYAGLDLQIHKISSLVLVSENVWKAYFWLPEKQLSKSNIFVRWKYRDWISQGLIRLMPGDVADYDIIVRDIFTIKVKSPFAGLAFDRWGSSAFLQKLSIADVNVIELGQGFSTFSPVCHEYIRSKPTFENPVLKWMDRNLSFLTDPAGNMKPNRQKGEIGGIVAGLMAISLSSISTSATAEKNSTTGSTSPAIAQ